MVLELAFFRMVIKWHIHLEPSLPLRSTTPKLKKNCYQLSSAFERCLHRGKVFIQTDHKVYYEEESAECFEEAAKNAIALIEV